MDIIINSSQGGYKLCMGATSKESSMNVNPGQWGGQCAKACPQLTREPGQLPGIYSSIGGIHECGDIQTVLDRSVVNIKY